MNIKTKKIFTNFRVIVLLLSLLLAIVAIHPDIGAKGAAIRGIIKNSSAATITELEIPKQSTPPMSREVIISLDNTPINSMDDYFDFISELKPNRTVQVRTNNGIYKLLTKEKTETIILNETETIIIEEIVTINESINGTLKEVNKTIERKEVVPKTKTISLGVEDIGFRVYDAPTTNIRKGLDLQGGTRVLLKPEQKQSNEDLATLIENMEQRLNVYGLSDLTVKGAGDLSGNQYIIVEIAGANEEEVKELLSQQGKFEAKISNSTVFIGGQDIKHVCKTPDCSGVRNCGQTSDGTWVCEFDFAITLSTESAERFADSTRNLEVVKEERGSYLSQQIILYLDDNEVDSLNIASDLKGKAQTDIMISGPGIGNSQQDAIYNSANNMKTLQTVLKTGSLPVKLEIIKTDAISAFLGEEFIYNAFIIGLLAILVIAITVFIRYRKIQVVIPVLLTMSSEAIILLGVAALIGWNIDLAAIAGIIIAVGTGVDHQIVITDEILSGEFKTIFNWKERIKNAFFIITATYFTLCVAMIPLMLAGAGLLKGFALTTIIGASIGVFITRPAYAAVIEVLLKE